MVKTIINGLKYLCDIPREAMWMLAVDGRFYSTEQGPNGYEDRENNSIKQILDGLCYAINESQKPLSVDFIKSLHRVCMDKLKSQNPANPGILRTSQVVIGLQPEWVSLAELNNFLSKEQRPQAHLYYTTLVSYKGSFVELSSLNAQQKENAINAALFKMKEATKLSNGRFSPGRLPIGTKLDETLLCDMNTKEALIAYAPPALPSEALLESILNEYNVNSMRCQNPISTLTVITKTVKALTCLHPFRDGNNRVFVNCLLNRLLMENEFPPVIFYDPNIFEFHTIEDLVQIIQARCSATMAFTSNPNQAIFDFNPVQSDFLNKEKFILLGHNFLLSIKQSIASIANIYYKKREFESAGQAFELCYQLCLRLLGEVDDTAMSYRNLGSCLRELAKLSSDTSRKTDLLKDSKNCFLLAQSIFNKRKSNKEDTLGEKIQEVEYLLKENVSVLSRKK